MSPRTAPRLPMRSRPNEMTSVGPSWPRYRRLRREIAARPTKVIESIASRTRSARRVAAAASLMRARDTVRRRTLDEMSMARPRGEPFNQPSTRVSSGSRVLGVRFDDLAHQAVTHDVRVIEIVESDSIDAGQDALDLHQPRLLSIGEVDLGLVACDHGLR